MKRLVRLTEGDLHKIVKESVNRLMTEIYNQFGDGDYASEGDPYGLVDDEEPEDNLNGYYGSFNHIWVEIKNDGKPNAYIMVGSNIDKKTQAFNGEEAQRILDKIRYDAEDYNSIHTAIYRNLYKYVL